MKKVLFVVIAALGFSHADAQTMQIIFHSSPDLTSPSWQGYSQNAVLGIEGGQSVGSGGPTTFTPLSGADIGTFGMVSKTSFPSWRGNPNPSAPFHEEKGNWIRAGLKVMSPSAFRLADLRFRLRSSDTSAAQEDGELAFSGNFSTSTYAPMRIGIWYGPDGIKGTSDDVRRTSGSAVNPVHELIYIGIGNTYTADSQTGLDQIRQYVQQKQPFSVTAEYTLGIGGSERQAVQTLHFRGRTELALNAPFTISGSGRVMVGTVTVTAQGEPLQGAFLEILGNYQPFLSRGGVDIAPMEGSTAQNARFALPNITRETPLVLQLGINTASGSGPYQLELQAHAAGMTSDTILSSPAEQRLIVVSSASSNISVGIDLNRAREPGGITIFAPAGSYEILRANAMGGPWISMSTLTKSDEPTRVLIPTGLPRQQFFRIQRR